MSIRAEKLPHELITLDGTDGIHDPTVHKAYFLCEDAGNYVGNYKIM